MTPEYTGPLIGDPPEHVHEEIPIEGLDDTQEEVDDLTAQVTALETVSATRHTELLERINTCQTRLETISSAATSENPLLTQIVSQLAEVRAELSSLKSSMDMRLSLPAPNELTIEEVTTESSELNPERSTEEPNGDAENPTPPKERKRRFV